MTTDLTTLWHTNRRWRAWMDEHTKFVTPDTLDTLRYALIESCECLDAHLRSKNPDHARNNGRDHTVESELADTAMLLLTAIPVQYIPSIELPSEDLDTICRAIINAIHWHKEPAPGLVPHWCLSAAAALIHIAAYPGLDLAAELDRCWRRLAWKHGTNQLLDWWLLSSISMPLDEVSPEMHPKWTLPVPWTVGDAQ